jgi:hypothetical protein
VANEVPVQPTTITITATGVAVPNTNAGGGLKPLTDGSYYATSPGAGHPEGVKRPHLRLVK